MMPLLCDVPPFGSGLPLGQGVVVVDGKSSNLSLRLDIGWYAVRDG